jgi:hypothetical protein
MERAVTEEMRKRSGFSYRESLELARQAISWVTQVANNSAAELTTLGLIADGHILDDDVLGMTQGLRFLQLVVIHEVRHPELFRLQRALIEHQKRSPPSWQSTQEAGRYYDDFHRERRRRENLDRAAGNNVRLSPPYEDAYSLVESSNTGCSRSALSFALFVLTLGIFLLFVAVLLD